MILDELAAAVVGLDAGNQQDLQRIKNLLQQYQAEGKRTDQEQQCIARALALVEQLSSPAPKNAEAAADELAAKVAELQEWLNAPQPASAATPSQSPAPAPAAGAEEENLLENDPEILAEFISDASEHLQTAESSLLALEADPGNQEVLNVIFRAFHSTKGTASFLGLNAIKELAHHAEMLLDHARKKELELKGSFADLALESADTLRSMVVKLAQGGKSALPANYAELMKRLDNPLETAPNAEPQTPAAAPQPQPAAPEAYIATAAIPAAPAKQTVEAKVAPQSKPAADAFAPAREDKDAGAGGQLMVPTVRVATDKLDGLINRVGELVIIHAMIAQYEEKLGIRNQGWTSSILQLERITRELQDMSMSLRMVPLKPTFQKMERLVRDVAKKAGKSVQFVTEGEDTEIDRNMVESLNDPLVHMLRNAIDHGLEPAEARRALGKPETGTLVLRAYHGAGNVVIELQDDGRGLNRDKILRKALEKQLVDPNRELSDAEVFKLIFLPGFSTADKVTDISGRGVGLDVVKKNIEQLHGRVEINSAPGQSTQFTLRIPLTLAIIEGMLLQVGERQYILPTLSVQKTFRPVQQDLLTLKEKGEMVRDRQHLYPIFRLHRLFNIANAVEDPTQALLILVEHEGEVCALQADALIGQ